MTLKEAASADIAAIEARLCYWATCWSGVGDEPLFFPVTHTKTGKQFWQMSERLYLIESVSFCPSDDRDIGRARRVLTMATQRCEMGILPGEPGTENISDDEAMKALCFLVMPLASKLKGIKRNDPAGAERIKQQALHWVAQVIDNTFPDHLDPDGDLQRAADLTQIAHLLCQFLDAIPTKKEVWQMARIRDRDKFTLGDTEKNRLLAMAGLKDLPQSRSGGRPKK
jgi:hypothetical protein